MTIMEMIQQGMVSHLIIVGILFVLMGVMISKIDVAKTTTAKEVPADTAAVQKTSNMPAVTAAITAAVNEYRKNN